MTARLPPSVFAALPPKHRIAFAASCCERLLPNYHAFASTERWGEPTALRQALDEVWRFAAGAIVTEQRIDALVRACRSATPDLDDFSSLLASLALDAAAAVVSTLECCLDGASKRVAEVSELAIASVDTFLNAVNDPDPGVHGADKAFDEWLRNAPLMRAELAHQRRDLIALQSAAVLERELLPALQRDSASAGLQLLARGIVKGTGPL